MMKRTLCIVAALGAFGVSQASAQNVTRWHEGAAVLSGDVGCDDAVVTAFGSDVVVDFGTSHSIMLEPGDFMQRRSCRVTIPVTVADGDYTPTFRQETKFGIMKQPNTWGQLAIAGTMLGQQVPATATFHWGVPAFAAVTTLGGSPVVMNRFNPGFSGGPWSCPPGGIKGLYQGDFAVAGMENGQQLRLFVDGVGLSHRLTVTPSPWTTVCSLP